MSANASFAPSPASSKLYFRYAKKREEKARSKWQNKTHLAHAAINDEIGAVDKTALIAGEEEYRLGLLDCFAEAASWKVQFAALSLGYIIAEPVLEKRCAEVRT